MKKELNLQCPYRVSLDTETFTYSFTTNQGVKYNVAFSDYAWFFDETIAEGLTSKIYSLDLVKCNGTDTEYKDFNIRHTIEAILTEFFKDPANILVYLCDNSDNKEHKRHNLFNRWYEQSANKVSVTKLDERIETEHMTFYITMLLRANNPHNNALKKGYIEVINSYRQKD